MDGSQPRSRGGVDSMSMSHRLVVIAGIVIGMITMLVQSAFVADKIVLQLKWKHQSEFAGYYVRTKRASSASRPLSSFPPQAGPALLLLYTNNTVW